MQRRSKSQQSRMKPELSTCDALSHDETSNMWSIWPSQRVSSQDRDHGDLLLMKPASLSSTSKLFVQRDHPDSKRAVDPKTFTEEFAKEISYRDLFRVVSVDTENDDLMLPSSQGPIGLKMRPRRYAASWSSELSVPLPPVSYLARKIQKKVNCEQSPSPSMSPSATPPQPELSMLALTPPVLKKRGVISNSKDDSAEASCVPQDILLPML